MEHRVPQAAPQAELRTKAKRQHQRAHALNGKGGLQNKARHADDAAHLGRGDGLLHDPPLLQADPLAGKHKNRHSHGDHAHAAHLDEKQNDQLPKAGPVACRIMDHKAGHAGGGGRGEQRIEKRGSSPFPCGKRQHQQRRSQQDQQQKAEDDNAGR